jgi:hypothetical protein
VKIPISIWRDEVASLLCLAVTREGEELLDETLNKAQIKEICARMLRGYGLGQHDGWSDYLTEEEAATINAWACAQAYKYTW